MDKMPDRPSDIVSYVPWRYGQKYKYHNQMAHAKSAVALKGFGTIYVWNWETDEWEIAWHVPKQDLPYGQRARMPWND